MSGAKREETGDRSMKRSSMICTMQLVLLGWSIREGWDRLGM